MRRALLCSLVLLAPLTAVADEVPPGKIAKVRYETEQAMKEIDAQYGNRKPSELSSEERSEIAAKQAAASAKILESNGVSAKDFARSEAKMSLDARAEAAAAEKKLEEQAKEKAAQAAAGKKDAEAQADEETTIEFGSTDEYDPENGVEGAIIFMPEE